MQIQTVDFEIFQEDMDYYLTKVVENGGPMHFKHGHTKGVVLISEKEFNSLSETLHLLGNRNNAQRIYESFQQMNVGKAN